MTTVADAGSPGPGNFQDFSEVVLDQAQTKVYSFISIFRDRSSGMMTDESEIDVDGVVKVALSVPDWLKGSRYSYTPGRSRQWV